MCQNGWKELLVSEPIFTSFLCSIELFSFKIIKSNPFSANWFPHTFRSEGMRVKIGLDRKGQSTWIHVSLFWEGLPNTLNLKIQLADVPQPGLKFITYCGNRS